MAAKPGGAIQGSFPSLKLERSIPYTSTLERDLLFVLEYETQVLRYQEQPFVVTAWVEGSERRYTPDYALWTETGQTLVECKPAALLSDPHTQQQIAVGTPVGERARLALRGRDRCHAAGGELSGEPQTALALQSSHRASRAAAKPCSTDCRAYEQCFPCPRWRRHRSNSALCCICFSTMTCTPT